MGLASASGLNLHLPLLLLGLANRFTNAIHLPAPYDILSHPWALIALAILCVVESAADKIPVVDHAFHAVGMVLQPVAGAVLFLATTQGHVDPAVAAIAGLVLAGTTHAIRAGIRPVSTATTGGTANSFLSAAEDTASGVLTLSAIFVPALVAVFLLVLVVFVFRMRRRWRIRVTEPS